MSRYSSHTAEAGTKVLCAHNVLSADEEIELSKRILAGEAAKTTLSTTENLTHADRTTLEQTARDGDLAYEQLVLSNIPRASKIAAEAFRKNPNGLNEYEDYLQTAMKVICSCARTFDWSHSCRFGTYVYKCLQHEMMRENALCGYVMHIPEENLSRLSVLKEQAETDGIDRTAKLLGMNRENAAKLLNAGTSTGSLQDPVNMEDPDMDLGDTIADARAVTADEIERRIDLEANLKRLHAAFSSLPDEERSLLKGRMGFEGTPLPMKAFVGKVAKSVSGVQKKQIAAERHLREIYFSLPAAD